MVRKSGQNSAKYSAFKIVAIEIPQVFFIRCQRRLKKNRVEFFMNTLKSVTRITADIGLDATPPGRHPRIGDRQRINVCCVDGDLVFHGNADRLQT
jgi:hypothetical protein